MTRQVLIPQPPPPQKLVGGAGEMVGGELGLHVNVVSAAGATW